MTTLSDTPGEGLAPCPFCGGEAELKHGAPDGYFVWHKCGWKGFASEMFGYRCSTEADAIAAWNRRSPSVASVTAGLPSGYEGVKELCTKFFYWWHNQPGTNTQAGFDDWWKVEGEAIAALGQVQPVATANCCKCGRIVDTRERSEGGDPFGAVLNDGQWVCSIECWEAVVDTDATPPAPQPALALIEELTGALKEIADAARRSAAYWNGPQQPSFLQLVSMTDTALASAKRFKGE